MTLPDDLRDWLRPFPAELTGRAVVEGFTLYDWHEQTPDPSTGAYSDTPGGRSGTTSNSFVREVNDVPVDVSHGPVVWLRFRGMRQGRPSYDFLAPPETFPARIDSLREVDDVWYYGWYEVTPDATSGDYEELTGGRSGSVAGSGGFSTLTRPAREINNVGDSVDATTIAAEPVVWMRYRGLQDDLPVYEFRGAPTVRYVTGVCRTGSALSAVTVERSSQSLFRDAVFDVEDGPGSGCCAGSGSGGGGSGGAAACALDDWPSSVTLTLVGHECFDGTHTLTYDAGTDSWRKEAPSSWCGECGAALTMAIGPGERNAWFSMLCGSTPTAAAGFGDCSLPSSFTFQTGAGCGCPPIGLTGSATVTA